MARLPGGAGGFSLVGGTEGPGGVWSVGVAGGTKRFSLTDTERRSDALITLWFTTQWLARCGKCEYWKNQGSVLTTQFR